MTGTQFVQYVKAKLNRIDTAAYEDVRPEEIFLFAQNAMKKLTLAFDAGNYSASSDPDNLRVYLSSVTRIYLTEVVVTGNLAVLPLVLKIKDLQAKVKVTSTNEEGWMKTREVSNDRSSSRESNVFTASFPDAPAYRIISGSIKFDASPIFTISAYKMEYLEYPPLWTALTNINLAFIEDVQDLTVTLILENLESRRIATQPSLSRT